MEKIKWDLNFVIKSRERGSDCYQEKHCNAKLSYTEQHLGLTYESNPAR